MSNGKPVGFKIISEGWNVYQLDDGSVVKMRVIASSMARFDDMRDANGDPGYGIQSQVITSVEAAPGLREKPEDAPDIASKQANNTLN